jgi:biopolymer transport protein ExbD
VALKIDKKTPYEKVAEVLDVLQMEKIYNIQFVNELKKE